MRRVLAGWPRVVLLVVGLTVAALPSSGREEPAADLESLVAEALARSAELYSLAAEVAAAEAMIAPAGALMDPMLSVGLQNIPTDAGLALDQDPMSGLEVMVSQEVANPAKRRLRRDVKAAELEVLRARYRTKRLEIIRAVTQAYVELQYVDARIEIAQQSLDLARDMLAAAEAAYAAGRVMQQDVFRAQVRVSKLLDTLISLQGERRAALARLNRLLYRPADAALPSLPPLKPTPMSIRPEALLAAAEASSPELGEMRARVAQARVQEQLAAAGLRPDYRLEFAYMLRESGPDGMGGTDMWSLSAGMTLPWVYRSQTVDQEVKAARAMREAAEHEVDAMRNEIAAAIAELMAEITAADQQLSLLDTGLLPQAEGAFAATRAAYVAGRGDMSELLDSQMTLLDLQMDRAMTVAMREEKIAELDYLAGGALSAAREEGNVR